jgi:hypothetical protein
MSCRSLWTGSSPTRSRGSLSASPQARERRARPRTRPSSTPTWDPTPRITSIRPRLDRRLAVAWTVLPAPPDTTPGDPLDVDPYPRSGYVLFGRVARGTHTSARRVVTAWEDDRLRVLPVGPWTPARLDDWRGYDVWYPAVATVADRVRAFVPAVATYGLPTTITGHVTVRHSYRAPGRYVTPVHPGGRASAVDGPGLGDQRRRRPVPVQRHLARHAAVPRRATRHRPTRRARSRTAATPPAR